MATVDERSGAGQSMSLPKPAEIIIKDFRPASTTARSVPADRPIRLVQWNIERGYELRKVIEELQRLDADVIALQEIDIGCERSGYVDTGVAIAEALHLNYVFLCEFEELHSQFRDARSQGGGVHGNGILGKFDLTNCRAIEHRHHPVDWEDQRNPMARSEPRRGRRLTLAATAQCPAGPLVVYSAHLEVFCGMFSRIAQFADILCDSREQIKQGFFHQAILGDLNTMAHGIARLSPNYCCDKMRYWSIGRPEAQFWHHNVICVPDIAFSPERDGQPAGGKEQDMASVNARLRWWGMPEDVCKDALNPGFSDPFDPVQTITLNNPSFRILGYGLVKGKLDWLLLRRLTVARKSIGNDSYSASDHKWLSADVTFA